MLINKIFHQDSTGIWPFRNESVDSIITSPPYWHHRDNGSATTTIFDADPSCEHQWKQALSRKEGHYCVRCKGWKGQLGQEPDPADYIRHLVEIFTKEGRRVLKPSGQLWVNLGDCYGRKQGESWLQRKQKLLLPARFAIQMQDQGWLLRNDIIWAKSVAFSNGDAKGGGMPSSVHTRLNSTHEYFFFFVKPSSDQRPYYVYHTTGVVSRNWTEKEDCETKDYFSYLDSLRIKHKWVNSKGERIDFYGRLMGSRPNAGGSPKQHAAGQPHLYMYNHPLGRNPGSVWQFNTEPFQGEHNSPYPPKLIQWIVRFSCPRRTCPECGLPEELFYDRKEKLVRVARCKCHTELHPGIVLDPFMGSGSTAIAALREHRHFIGMELNPHHLSVSEKRLRSEFPELFENKPESYLLARE